MMGESSKSHKTVFIVEYNFFKYEERGKTVLTASQKPHEDSFLFSSKKNSSTVSSSTFKCNNVKQTLKTKKKSF